LKTAPLIPKSISAKFTNAVRPQFIAAWNLPALNHFRFRALLVAFILSACFIRAYVGLWGSRIYTQDAFSILDGAWRVLNGQKPHIDFYTGLGPLIYLMTAAGVAIAHGNAVGLAYGQALFGCLAGLWAFCLSQKRLRGLGAMLVPVVVALLTIVPINIGEWPDAITPGGIYNRCGYALLSLLMIESCASARSDPKSSEFCGGLSTGAVLGMLLFLKMSFFMGAIFLLAVLLPLRSQTRQRWYGMGAAFCITVLAFLCYLSFDLAAVYIDLRTVAHAKHVMVGWYLVKDVVVCAFPFLLLVHLISRGVVSRREYHAIRVAGLGVCLAGLFLLMTSWQFFALPLDSVMAILLLERVLPQTMQLQNSPLPRLSPLLLGALFAINFIASQGAGLSYALSQKLHQTPHTSFTAPALLGFNSTAETDYVKHVNEGCQLLDEHRRPLDTVLALNFTNPFSFGLGMKPPAGGTTWLQYHTDFDEDGPSPERVFGSASLVMLPKSFSDRTLPDTVPRIYEPFLKAHYVLAAESRNWWLYRRKHTDAGGAVATFNKASAAVRR